MLAPKLDRLISMAPLAYGLLPRDMPKSGVYLFTEDGRHLYVGHLLSHAAIHPLVVVRTNRNGGRRRL
jgi:hypothetical protein